MLQVFFKPSKQGYSQVFYNVGGGGNYRVCPRRKPCWGVSILPHENRKQMQVTTIKIIECKENKSTHRLDLSGSTVPRGDSCPLFPPASYRSCKQADSGPVIVQDQCPRKVTHYNSTRTAMLPGGSHRQLFRSVRTHQYSVHVRTATFTRTRIFFKPHCFTRIGLPSTRNQQIR